MNIDEILYQILKANDGKIRITERVLTLWQDYQVIAKECSPAFKPSCYHDPGTGFTLISRKEYDDSRRYQVLKADQEVTRKRAQLGRERFEEFQAEGLNPTIAAALACLAEQIGMEKIKEAMTQAELQVKGKK